SDGERLAALSLPLQYIAIGETRDNLAITQFSVRNSPADEEIRQCFIQVYNARDTPIDTTLSLYFEDHLLGVEDLHLAPEDTDEAIFVLPALEEGILRAEIDREDALNL